MFKLFSMTSLSVQVVLFYFQVKAIKITSLILCSQPQTSLSDTKMILGEFVVSYHRQKSAIIYLKYASEFLNIYLQIKSDIFLVVTVCRVGN